MKIRLKMIKTTMFLAMLLCVLCVFCFGIMSASAMNSDEENDAKLSQKASNHTHLYSYERVSYKHHQLKCECGAVTGDLRPHLINASDQGERYAECIECGDLLDMNTDMALVVGTDLNPEPPHTHNFSYKRINNRNHQLKCDCGAVTGEKRPHIISSSDVGQRYAECIECHDLLDMNTDMALVGETDLNPEPPHTHKYTYTSIGIRQHKGHCECGATITANHKFIQIDIGQECIQCGYVVQFLSGMELDTFI